MTQQQLKEIKRHHNWTLKEMAKQFNTSPAVMNIAIYQGKISEKNRQLWMVKYSNYLPENEIAEEFPSEMEGSSTKPAQGGDVVLNSKPVKKPCLPPLNHVRFTQRRQKNPNIAEGIDSEGVVSRVRVKRGFPVEVGMVVRVQRGDGGVYLLSGKHDNRGNPIE